MPPFAKTEQKQDQLIQHDLALLGVVGKSRTFGPGDPAAPLFFPFDEFHEADDRALQRRRAPLAGGESNASSFDPGKIPGFDQGVDRSAKRLINLIRLSPKRGHGMFVS